MSPSPQLTLTALCSTVPTLKRLSQACLEGVVARLVKKKLAHIVEDAGGLGKVHHHCRHLLNKAWPTQLCSLHAQAVIFGHPFASQEVDGPLLSLRITMARLSKVVRSLEERAAASRRQATLCHRAKDKQGTLFHLKRHKLYVLHPVACSFRHTHTLTKAAFHTQDTQQVPPAAFCTRQCAGCV